MPVSRPAAVLLVGLLSAPLVLAAPASAASSRGTQTGLEADRTRARPGGTVELLGRVASTDRDDTGHRVVLEGRPAGGGSWTRLSENTTSGDPRRRTDGAAPFTLRRLSGDYALRLVHPEQTVRGTRFTSSTSRVVVLHVGGPRTFTLDDTGEDRAMRFDLLPGDRVVYRADECSSCGAEWTVTRRTDARYVALTGDETVEPQGEDRLPGAPSRRVFTWTAKAPASSRTAARTAATLTYGSVVRDEDADHVVTADFRVLP